MTNKIYKQIKKYTIFLLSITTIASMIIPSKFSVLADEREDRIASHEAMEIQSNNIENWPTGPTVAAESAILMDASTGTILYSKNIHKPQYPASTTKILTTLIAYNHCSLDEIVDFSYDAVHSIPAGSNNIAMDAGEQLTMNEAIQAILIRSANEVSYAVAEHVSGSFEAFAKLMNDTAKDLGCVDSNFVNPNGLPDEKHYTSAYDLAMIGREFFANEYLCETTTTPMLHIAPSVRQPDDILDANKMLLLPGKEYAYEYLVGCKTGYTDVARSTLVSCAEKDGLKLICVVLNDENPNYYQDTISLFNYGFSNFKKVNISQTDTKYNIDTTGSFYSSNDIFGSSSPLVSINKYNCILLPNTINFSDVSSEISYETTNESQVAVITYKYNEIPLGTASVDFINNNADTYKFDSIVATKEEKIKETTSFIFINIIKIFVFAIITVGLIFIYVFSKKYFSSYHYVTKNNRRKWKRERRKTSRNKFNKLQYKRSISSKRKAAIRQAKRHAKATAHANKRRG